MAYDAALHALILFGGGNDENVDYADTWAWDGATWIELRPRGSPPSRSHHVMASAGGRPVMFGGVRNLFEYLDDTWVLVG